MKVFIFGAGASKGSQNPHIEEHLKSPLMDELFKDVYLRYCHELGFSFIYRENYIKSVSENKGVEKYLTELWESIKLLKHEASKKAIKSEFGRLSFYIWNLLRSVSISYDDNNLYALLLRKTLAKDEDIGLVSFNYDTLLDKALVRTYGENLVGSVQSYTTGNVKLIKPHGSINWLLQHRTDDFRLPAQENTHDLKKRYEIASNLMFNGSELSMDNVVIFSPNDVDLQNIGIIKHPKFEYSYFYPLVFLPLLEKEYEFINRFNENIIHEGRRLILTADEIVIIGYQAKDDLIKELLGSISSVVKITVVSPNNPKDIADRVSKITYVHEIMQKKMTFREYVEKY